MLPGVGVVDVVEVDCEVGAWVDAAGIDVLLGVPEVVGDEHPMSEAEATVAAIPTTSNARWFTRLTLVDHPFLYTDSRSVRPSR